MLALGVQSWDGKSVKNDSRYLKFWSYTFDKVNDKTNYKYLITMHPCTDEDYEKFYTPDDDSFQMVKIMR